MLKKFQFLILLIYLLNAPALSNENIYIYVSVNDEIITNYDIEKEKEYLKILNPNLNQLDEKKVFDISKNSLIKKKIKKNEIEKKFNIKKTIIIVDQVFEDFYKKLGIDNENDFKNLLLTKKTYSNNEVKEKLKLEVFWNELIFVNYKNQLKINEEALLKKINNKNNKTKNEYLLSEIFFKKKKDQNLEDQLNKINNSIKEIGFNNTANIYSISESAKFGGKLDWINENNLSKIIFDELKKTNVGKHTKVIQVGNNFLILKLDNKRSKEVKFNKEKQLKQMINFERNKQLNQFSNIYFNKVKMNYYINEK